MFPVITIFSYLFHRDNSWTTSISMARTGHLLSGWHYALNYPVYNLNQYSIHPIHCYAQVQLFFINFPQSVHTDPPHIHLHTLLARTVIAGVRVY